MGFFLFRKYVKKVVDTTPPDNGGDGTAPVVASVESVTKTGATGAPGNPNSVIVNSSSTSIGFMPITAMKSVAGTMNVAQTKIDFNSGDASQFTGIDSDVLIDGSMSLKTDFEQNLATDNTWVDSANSVLLALDIDFSRFKDVINMGVV